MEKADKALAEIVNRSLIKFRAPGFSVHEK